MLFQALFLGVACLQVFEWYACAQFIGGNDPRIRRQAEQMGLLGVDDGFGAGNVGLECAHLRRLQGEPQSQLALAERGLRFFQVRDVDDRADRAHGPPAIGRIAVESPPLNGHPSHGPVGPHNSMQAAPFSSIGRVASRFQARGHGRLIARIEQPRRLRISQLRSCGQTQNGAQLGGEPSSVVLEIAVVNADTADLDCQAQQLIALVWRPNWGSTCAGGFFCGRSRGSWLRELLLRSIRRGGARPQSRLDGNSRSCPSPSYETEQGALPARRPAHVNWRKPVAWPSCTSWLIGALLRATNVPMLRPAPRRLRRKQRRRKRRLFYGKGAKSMRYRRAKRHQVFYRSTYWNGFNNPVYAAIGTAHESLRVYPECAGVLRVTLVGARSDGLAHAGHQPLDIERRYANFQPGYGWTCRGGDVGRSK